MAVDHHVRRKTRRQLKITRQHKTACKRGVIMKVEAFIYEQGDKEFEVKI